MAGISGNYYLRFLLGPVEIPINTSVIKEFVIIQDSNKFLPTFKISLLDTGGMLTHLAPSDKNMSNTRVEIGYDASSKPDNSFDFVTIRRMPKGNTAQSSLFYIEGLLNTANYLFGKSYCRSFTGKIKNSLTNIAINDLKLDEVDISPSLDYEKLIIQPEWSISQLLIYLRDNISGKNGETGYRCFIKRENHKSIFVFKTLNELIDKKIEYKFIVDSNPTEDRIPVYEYEIFDNYKIFGIFSSKKQAWCYFDYDNSKYVEGENSCQDLHSLSPYFLIDKEDSEASDKIEDTGRSNDFTSNFEGLTKNSYQNRLVGLLKMWVVTPGIANLTPGTTINILFGVSASTILSHQYSGFWLVEKVIFMFGEKFMTRILCTRGGIDTDLQTTLVKANTIKKEKI